MHYISSFFFNCKHINNNLLLALNIENYLLVASDRLKMSYQNLSNLSLCTASSHQVLPTQFLLVYSEINGTLKALS